MLKIVRTRKEARYIVQQSYVRVNNKVRKDEKFPVQLFDVIRLAETNKCYRLEIIKNKFALKEISEKEAEEKIAKISGKKILQNKKIQMNLADGQNFLYDKEFLVGDSVIVNTKENKIEKILKLKKGSKVEIILGKHLGRQGEIKEILELEREKRYIVKLDDKEINLPFEAIIVVG